MRYMLDTNIVIYIRRDEPQNVRRIFEKLPSGHTGLSVISFGELLYGIAKSSDPASGLEKLDKITAHVPVLPMPEQAGRVYGEIRSHLEGLGQPIGNNDLWIAAHALAADLVLVTNNEKEFRRIRGLKIENWAKN